MPLPLTPWFLCARPVLRPRFRLFCFPHAGGGASAFTSWSQLLAPAQIEVVAIQYPGRETRLGDDPLDRAEAIVGPVADAIERTPADAAFALLGHSMGGTLAFETARVLEQASARLPERLFISGRRPPHLALKPRDFEGAPDDAVLHYVSNLYGGIHPEVLRHEEMRSIVVRSLRADLALLRSYEFAGSTPGLGLPCTILGGRHDGGVTEAELREWAGYTSGGFSAAMFEGDHFFLYQNARAVVATVLEELRVLA